VIFSNSFPHALHCWAFHWSSERWLSAHNTLSVYWKVHIGVVIFFLSSRRVNFLRRWLLWASITSFHLEIRLIILSLSFRQCLNGWLKSCENTDRGPLRLVSSYYWMQIFRITWRSESCNSVADLHFVD
jgi:hypothetical protein